MFRDGAEPRPALAIARWGIAYAIGPNYNKAWEAFDPVDLAASLARARMELGLAADGRATPAEHGLIKRWPPAFPPTIRTTPTHWRPAMPPMPTRWSRWRRPIR